VRERALLEHGVRAWVEEILALPPEWDYDPGIMWDAVGCDRNYFGLGFKVVCDNGKRTIARVDLKYTIGRTDESIYVYRSSYQWKVPDVGCSLINGDLSCRGDSASFELSGLLGVQK
jgi:hypothetical protein